MYGTFQQIGVLFKQFCCTFQAFLQKDGFTLMKNQTRTTPKIFLLFKFNIGATKEWFAFHVIVNSHSFIQTLFATSLSIIFVF
jgi:hypothetical protein